MKHKYLDLIFNIFVAVCVLFTIYSLLIMYSENMQMRSALEKIAYLEEHGIYIKGNITIYEEDKNITWTIFFTPNNSFTYYNGKENVTINFDGLAVGNYTFLMRSGLRIDRLYQVCNHEVCHNLDGDEDVCSKMDVYIDYPICKTLYKKLVDIYLNHPVEYYLRY